MKLILISVVLFLASEAVATPTPPSKITSKASLERAVTALALGKAAASTSQLPMGPYLAIAFATFLLKALTAFFRDALLVNLEGGVGVATASLARKSTRKMRTCFIVWALCKGHAPPPCTAVPP